MKRLGVIGLIITMVLLSAILTACQKTNTSTIENTPIVAPAENFRKDLPK